MAMWEPFEIKLKRFQELEQQMADPVLVADRLRYSKIAKEHGTLTKQIRPYMEYKKLGDDLAEVESLIESESDADTRRYYKEEQATLAERKKVLQDRLEELLLIDPSEDYDSVIFEIRAGTGGDEAALFAGDLYTMYTRYSRDRGWKVEDISFSAGEQGGYKEVVFNVSGEDVFRFFRFESGGHRVQRVPKTETQGRIHTSAATVAVMPEPDEVEIEIRPQDIIREVMRAGGAGGQHVNKTESAVRLWYKKGTPDELEVKCQDERSQHKNEAQAMRILRSRLFERNTQRLHDTRAEQRRTLIGSGARSEKIRTYNFPQNRVTDHRIGLTLYKLDAIIAGNMTDLLEGIRDFDRKQRLGGGTAGNGERET